MNAIVTVAERIERWSEPALDGCRNWSGQVGSSGYGVLGVGKSKKHSAHRVAYEVAKGPIAPGLCVLHRCDNRLCVNPAHLSLGTRKDNTQDMIAKGRRGVSPLKARTHCPQGHPHTGKTNNKGLRICAICAKAATARWVAKQKAQGK